MEQERIDFFMECATQAFNKVLSQLTGLNFTADAAPIPPDSMKVTVIIGITGQFKGRFLLEVDGATARKITEGMNDGPLEQDLELYLFLAEFTNMVSGNTITKINNAYKTSDLRLVPPAIFSGTELEITTPHIKSRELYFGGDGRARINIGFEGV